MKINELQTQLNHLNSNSRNHHDRKQVANEFRMLGYAITAMDLIYYNKVYIDKENLEEQQIV